MRKQLPVLAVLIMAAFMAGCGADEAASYVLTVEIEGEGRTTPAAGLHRYSEDTEITLNASPGEGWQFKEWIGPVAEPQSDETVLVMDGDCTVRAVFVPGDDDSSLAPLLDFDRPARGNFAFKGEGFRVEAEGWNCTGLVGQWQWRYELEILAHGTLEGEGTFILPPQPEEGPWLTPPYSFTISGTLESEDFTVEISCFFEDMVNEIIVRENGTILINTRGGTSRAVVRDVLPETTFVLSDTHEDVISDGPGVIVFERHPECD